MLIHKKEQARIAHWDFGVRTTSPHALTDFKYLIPNYTLKDSIIYYTTVAAANIKK